MAAQKPKEYEFKKNEILKAAAILFNENGFEHTTLKDIAKESGYTRKTLYSYFDNKIDLICATYLIGAKERYIYIEKAAKKNLPGIEKLYAIGDAYYRYFKRNKLYLKLQIYWYNVNITEDDIRKEILGELKSLTLKGANLIRDCLRSGVDDGTIRGDIDVEYVFNHFVDTINIVLRNAIIPPVYYRQFVGKKYFFDYLDHFIRGLRP